MRRVALVLLLFPAALMSQQTTALDLPVTVEIRSADSSRVLNVQFNHYGSLFQSIGVLRPANGEVNCGPDGCVATTPAVVTFRLGVGEATLRVPESSAEMEVTLLVEGEPSRRLTARGRTMTFSRSEGGQLILRAPSVNTRF